jgi:hypothetical protein
LELHLHPRAHGRNAPLRRAHNLRVRHWSRGHVGHRWPRDLGLHHARGRTADSPYGPSKPRSGLEHRAGGQPAPGGAADSRSGKRSSHCGGLGAGLVGRRRALDGHGDDLLAAEQEEAERAALLAVAGGGLGGLGGREAAELLAVAEDEVHVAVEGHELAHELAAVLDRHAHAVVDELEHLGALRVRHGGGGRPWRRRLGLGLRRRRKWEDEEAKMEEGVFEGV